MSATTIVVVIACALLGTYLYVMALCHLADLLAQRKENVKQLAEKRRKEDLRQALDLAEMNRKREEGRRRQEVRARNERRATTTANRVSEQRTRRSRPKPAAARA